jgi:tRNA(Ile)-lysidine synthase
MNLTERFQHLIIKEALFNKGNRLLLAVSGGVDSVVLCELCRQAGYNFSMAHCNFRLRGSESERDEQFVRGLADHYGVELFVKQFDTEAYAKTQKLSVQVAARELRYEWFHKLLMPGSIDAGQGDAHQRNPYDFIVTAHHADDNLETMLMNVFKGTGIAGLRGILPKQEKLVRPLLLFYKEELHAFATGQKLAYVEDSSNQSDKYTRNYFRNQLIPSLEKVFPAVKSNLIDNIKRFSDIEQLYHQAIAVHKKKLLEIRGEEVHIPVLKLAKTTPLEAVLYEIIKDYGFSSAQLPEVIDLLHSETGRYIRSTGYRIIRNRNWLIIAPAEASAGNHFVIGENEKTVSFPGGKLEFKRIPSTAFQLSARPDVAALDAKQVGYPLLLRKWKQGDYFYPLGMPKKKKVSRFLIDQKLSITEKEQTWVLESNKKILWVVGRRIDDRFRIAPATKDVLQISLTVSG